MSRSRERNKTVAYFGGKGGSFRTLINQIPPHDTYIEAFLGGGAVMRNKKPALESFGVDLDCAVITAWAHESGSDRRYEYKCVETNNPSVSLFSRDAMEFLKHFQISEGTFLYCDPPYILETRKSGARYKYEFSKEQHIKLLKLLVSLDCMVMISGYRHEIYDDALKNWRRIDYKANTRGGFVDESAWMNYPEPMELHDYRYLDLGGGFREREKITRQTKRWLERLKKMPILHRKKIIAAILAMDGGTN